MDKQMPGAFRISLKSGERIFVNGAILRADRKVTIELLNEVSFLLEQHVMAQEDANTPLRKLYVLVQDMILDPVRAEHARETALLYLVDLQDSATDADMRDRLASIASIITYGRAFEALKLIRMVMPQEKAVAPRAARTNVA